MTTTVPQFLPQVFRKKVHRDIADGLQGLHEEQVSQYRAVLPNFIIIGAAKSATTTLATVLPRHPEIFFPRHKEPKFFGRCYGKGWDWYGRIFRPGRRYPFRGEASTMYASPLGSFRHTPALIHRYLPDVKLIYIVRHPLDRLVSHWRHLKGRHPRYVAFERILAKRSAAKRLIGCSSYYTRLQEFRCYFPDQQIHCLTFEDLIASPRNELSRILNFLGATNSPDLLLNEGQLPKENEAGDKGRLYVPQPSWPPGMRQKMIELLKPEAQQFLAYIGKPTDYWTW